MDGKRALLLPLVVLTWVLSSSGCLVVPIRVPTQKEGPSSTGGSTDLSFLKVGQTTRKEVEEKLAWMDTGYRHDRLFLGRWVGSRWGVLWAAAGGYSGAAGGFRLWDRHNLIIEFDEAGVVQRFSAFPDKDLLPEITAWVAKGVTQPLDLSASLSISVAHKGTWEPQPVPGKLKLGRNLLEFDERPDGNHWFSIPPCDLASLSYVDSFSKNDASAAETLFALHLRNKTPAGRRLVLRTEVPQLILLLRYIRDSCPPAREKTSGSS